MHSTPACHREVHPDQERTEFIMYDNLFEPLQIGDVRIANRITRSAHGAGLRWPDVDNSLIDYHAARAKGGVGLLFLSWGGVHSSSSLQYAFYDKSIIPGATRIAEAVHEHDTKMFVQLVHRGNQLPNPSGPPWSASTVPNPLMGLVPIPMTKPMIDEVVEGFVHAAANSKAAGMDGVEIQAGHGYLLGEFLSPATNLREDEYGGSPENRVRFLQEVLTAVRDEVGPGFAVGVRVSADEEVEDGIHPPDAVELMSLVTPQIDFLDVSIGSYYRYHRMASTMDDPLGYELPYAERVTREVDVPTIVTGRIMTLDHASAIIESGQADMVSIVRALIADPELLIKSRERREHEIRPCIGSSQGCVGSNAATGRLSCVVNVAAGNESSVSFEPDRAATPVRVTVVGGGPAGLEAARTAAVRGHTVHLFEMTNALGGQVKIGATAPNRSDFGAITAWLADEMERLDVTVKLRTLADVDVVLESEPDVVIIATGSSPRRDGFQANRPRTPIPGFDLPHVYSSWDLFGFGGRASVGERAVVFDDTGRYEALSVADELLERGASVTFISAHGSLGARVDEPISTVAPVRERLLNRDFEFIPHTALDSITSEAVIATPLGAERKITVPADTVVIVGYNSPERDLADALTEEAVDVHIIGDADGGFTLQQAIHDAARVARSI